MQADFAVVHERVASGEKRSRRSRGASRLAWPSGKPALAAALAVDARLECEEGRRIERIDVLVAAADVAHGGPHAEDDRHDDRETVRLAIGDPRPVSSRGLQGSTS
jgi:hypothetical protein